MRDPRVYALVFGAFSGAATFLVAFGSQRVAGIELETAFWIALIAALTPYAARQAEGFRDAQKPETITRQDAIDALEVELSKWGRKSGIPISDTAKDVIIENVILALDFNDDYHFAVDGSGRHRGQSVGCTKCSAVEIG